MKLFKVIMLVLALAIAAPAAYGQMTQKELKKELKKKVDKDCRKEAKTLKKDGWRVMSGKLPLERQLQESRYADLDVDELGNKRFFVGTHRAIGGNYSAAKQIADNRARQELAASISAEIVKAINDNVANHDLGDGDIDLLDEFVSSNKTVISAQLQGVIPVLEMYRMNEKKQYEVEVSVKTDAAKSLKLAKSGLYNELRAKNAKLAEELDKLLPY